MATSDSRYPSVDEAEFKRRTKVLALNVIELTEHLPKTRTGDVIGRQLLRSATSVGANYRAACRARSISDMVSKLGIVEEEADETLYWLDLLTESRLVSPDRAHDLMRETHQLLAMVVSSRKTLRARSDGRTPPGRNVRRSEGSPD